MRVPRRITTWLRSHSSRPMKANTPSTMRLSISKVISLRDDRTRS